MQREAASQALQRASQALRDGGVCLYPTETFYALGCDARNPEAVSRLLRLKERPFAQGAPVVIGHLDQLEQACSLAPGPGFPESLRELAVQLMERFWPGPLSLVLPAAAGLAHGVPREGSVALRHTPHPVAGMLCQLAQTPLVASSANLRGEPAVCEAKNLNSQLLQSVAEVVTLPPAPSGGLPSTLAQPVLGPDGRPSLRILRLGAVAAEALAALQVPVLRES